MERDKRARTIGANWDKEAANLSTETLDKIGELWITKILDCSPATVELFKTDELNNEIGLKHAGDTSYQSDSRGFWEEVHKIAPKLAPKEDLEYLIEHDNNGDAAWVMICNMDGNIPMNCLITKLVNNALLYK